MVGDGRQVGLGLLGAGIVLGPCGGSRCSIRCTQLSTAVVVRLRASGQPLGWGGQARSNATTRDAQTPPPSLGPTTMQVPAEALPRLFVPPGAEYWCVLSS